MRQQIKKLMLGNGLAQLLQFGSILLLSRIYKPSDFGLLAQVQSIAMILTILLTLQLPLTIPLSISHEEALEKVKKIQSIIQRIFIIMLIPAMWNGEITLYAIILSFFLGITNTYTAYWSYSGDFGKVSIFYILRAVLIIVMQFSFSYFEMKDGLIIASLAGEALSAYYLCSRKVFSPVKNIKGLTGLKFFIISNKPFSLYGTIQEVLAVAAYYAPLILFNLKYGENIGGQYAMANRLVWAPIVLVSSSYAQVLYHKLARENQISICNIKKLIPDAKISAIITGLVLIAFNCKELYRLILGHQWGLAIEFIPLQLLWGVFFLGSTPFRVAARILHLQRNQLTIDVIMIALFSLLFYIFPFEPIDLMITLLILVFFQHASIIIMTIRKSKTK